jgi:hypothetical protein
MTGHAAAESRVPSGTFRGYERRNFVRRVNEIVVADVVTHEDGEGSIG